MITKFSDKWSTQGGRSSLIADYGTGTGTITLHKTYKNINYSIIADAEINSTADDTSWHGSYYIQYPNKTVSNFKIYCRGSLGGGKYLNWQTQGLLS